jgi:AcrR family transcriptional regulator
MSAMKVAPRTPRQAAKREHIVGAASRVFAARPYHVVCMDDVAEAARVGKGTLYRYFPSKEDLYLGVVAGAFDLLIRRLERVEAEELPPAVALSRMIEAIVETFARHLPSSADAAGEARLFLRRSRSPGAPERIAAGWPPPRAAGARRASSGRSTATRPSMLIGWCGARC